MGGIGKFDKNIPRIAPDRSRQRHFGRISSVWTEYGNFVTGVKRRFVKAMDQQKETTGIV